MKAPAAALAFVFIAVLAAVALAFIFSGLGMGVATASLALGLAGAVGAWFSTKPNEPPPLKLWDWIMLGVFALVSLRAFCWLIYLHNDEIWVLSPNNLGDMSLHLEFIRYFASGIHFWPASPILTGTPLIYPLGADLFNALGEVCGVDTFHGLVLVGLAGAALTGWTLWRWGGAFALAAFLFNGGLAGFVVFRTLYFQHSFQIEDFQTELQWKNFFLAMFVTQRGLLVALPAGLLLLTTWRDTFFRQKPSALPLWLQFILYAGMPLFNVHAFLFLSLLLAGIFILQKAARPALLWLVGLSLIPASAGMYLVTGFFSTTSFVKWMPGWLMTGKDGAAVWWWDFGVLVPLLIVLVVMLARSRDREARYFVGYALFIFALCSVVTFAPWSWDNMKIIIWSWLLLAPYLWGNLIAKLPLLFRLSLCFILFFSGAVSLAGGLDGRHGYTLAKRSEMDAWRHALIGVPADTRFAINSDDYNHPVMLLGHPVACGYGGHLWSHGLNYQAKLNLLNAALQAKVPWSQAAPALNVSWLALQASDFQKMGANFAPEGSLGLLYDLRPFLATPSPGSPAPQQGPPRSVDLSW